ncbi:MAG: fumarylacetoacetate hydrolase family protein [Planctomycetaceae bacterium]
MKLAQVNTAAGIRLVSVDGSNEGTRYVDLCAVDSSLPNCLRAVLGLEDGLDRCRAAAQQGAANGKFVEATEVLAPIKHPGKIICIGLNYRDHALETNSPIPSEPVCFGKFGNTIIGTEATIRIPAVCQNVDFEAELVVVIGRRASRVAKEDAFNYVAGYMNGHDVSARDWQKGRPGGQWLLGKSPDTFAPIGPWLVTADEVADPHALDVVMRLNGEVMQQGNTKEFIFGVDEVIAHLTQLITLEPGDLIFTGTPAGVGMGREPRVWMKPGDVAEVEITGLGTLRNPVAAE